jgi:YD repeat-containing protein
MSDPGTAIAFADDNTVVVMGNLSQTMRSTDSGQTWTVGFIAGGSNVYRLRFANPSTGLAVGANGGQIARTVDGGESWSIIGGGILDQMVTGLAASQSGSVVLAGALNAPLLRSITSGATWSETGERYSSPAFASEQVALAIRQAGQIARSTDAGQTWTVVYNQLGAVSLASTTMATASVGLVVGDNGLILRTTDGGLSWATMPSGTTLALKTVRCLTATVCLAGGYPAATLLRSSDAGATWSPVTIQLLSGSAFIRGFARISDTVAIIATDSELQRSPDGGQTWTRVYTSVIGSQLGVSFNGAGTGIVVGYDGILRSTDYGLSWVRQSLPISFNLFATTWLDANTVLVGGEGGAILRNLQGGAP